MLNEVEEHLQRFGIRHLAGEIDRQALDVADGASLADALGDRRALRSRQLARRKPVEHGGPQGVDQPDPGRRPGGAQGFCHARQRAAGAYGADEAVHATAGLFEDFRAGRGGVGGAIRQVVELIGPEGASLLRHPLRYANEVAGVAEGDLIDFQKLGARQADGVLLLLALGAGDDHQRPIAQRPSHYREPDAGVAGGALHDETARLQGAAGLRIPDDAERRTILHGAAGVHELRLAQNLATRRRAGAVQADQGRVPDGVDHAGGDRHGVSGRLTSISVLAR